jgi:hypothetical protein
MFSISESKQLGHGLFKEIKNIVPSSFLCTFGIKYHIRQCKLCDSKNVKLYFVPWDKHITTMLKCFHEYEYNYYFGNIV